MLLVFGDKEPGTLTDRSADVGEQQGLRFLFAGAFGAVRNPLGHRNFEWEDSTEAAEMILLADLLMRQLDRVAERLHESDPQGQPIRESVD